MKRPFILHPFAFLLFFAFGVCGEASAGFGNVPSPGLPGGFPGGGFFPLASVDPSATQMAIFGACVLGALGAYVLVLTAIDATRKTFGRQPTVDDDIRKLAEQMAGLAPQEKVDVLIARLSECASRVEVEAIESQLSSLVVKTELTQQFAELWKVANGLRKGIGALEANMAAEIALRKANGERMAEVSKEVRDLSEAVHEMLGMMRSKKEARS